MIINVINSTLNQARLRCVQKTCEIIRIRKNKLKLHWISNHAKVENNETTNKMTKRVHELSLSFSKQQTCEITIKIAFIREKTKVQ